MQAFNCETAKIRSVVKEETAGRGRLAWWRQAIAQALSGNPPDHPVAMALAHIHAQHNLTARYLTQLLDAREADMGVLQPQTRDELMLYCERTAGSLLLLSLECSGQEVGEHAEWAAHHGGTALGLATLLRGTASHAAHGCTYLPAEVTARHEVSLSSMLRGESSHELCAAMHEVHDEAVAHLLAARSMRAAVPPSCLLYTSPSPRDS